MSDFKKSLGIAYEMKKRNAKKMANGGAVEGPKASATMQSQNSGAKAASMDRVTDAPTVMQARKPSMVPLSAPRMVGSDAFSVRVRANHGAADEFMDSIPPSPVKSKKTPGMMDSSVETGYGPSPSDMSRQHSNGRKAYAMGGTIDGDYDSHTIPDDMDDEEMSPPVDEYMSKRMFAKGGQVEDMPMAVKPANVSRPDNGWGAIISKADGGMIDESEMDEEEHASIADAIMAKAKKMAAGGMVDIESNEEESPNGYDDRDEAILKEHYGDDMSDLDQPDDSNETGDAREDAEEDKKDRVKAIMSKRKRM